MWETSWYTIIMEPTNMNGEVSRKMTPKFFFLSLGVLVSLITSVTAFLNLAFETLDFKFPDVLNATYQYGYSTYTYDSARQYIAILVIFLPVFFVLARLWKKAVQKGLGSIDDAIRKWMTYFIIFLSVLVTAIDLVTLVRYFVGGEITTRFLLKVGITLLTALLIGVYYVLEIHGTTWKKTAQMIIPWFSGVCGLALVILSFAVIGTPNEQRLWRLDDKRVQDLQSIQQQVITYWQQKQKLPEKLSDLVNPTAYYTLPVDPEFEKGKAYEYTPTGALSFTLCADFSAKMPKGWQEYRGGGVMPMYETGSATDVAISYPYPGYGTNQSWDHEVGKKCFDRTIDKDLYPPYPKPLN